MGTVRVGVCRRGVGSGADSDFWHHSIIKRTRRRQDRATGDQRRSCVGVDSERRYIFIQRTLVGWKTSVNRHGIDISGGGLVGDQVSKGSCGGEWGGPGGVGSGFMS